MAWTIAPPLALGMRGRAVIRDMRDFDATNLSIPEAAFAVHQDICLHDRALRLSVVMWELPPAETEREWSLLAILEPLPEDVADGDVVLRIADAEKTLVERTLLPGSQGEGAQGIGFLAESLTISLTFASGDVLQLPPFQF
jgi:hypothetical protein